jgi:ribonuclease J
VGVPEENIFVMTDGDVLQLTPKGEARVVDRLKLRNTYIDGLRIGDVDNVVLRDRAALSREGVVVVIVPVDMETGEMVGDLDIISRGFVEMDRSEDLLDRALDVVERAIDRASGRADPAFIESKVREALGQYFYQETRRRPMILTIPVEL